jgi:hypothetical protein
MGMKTTIISIILLLCISWTGWACEGGHDNPGSVADTPVVGVDVGIITGTIVDADMSGVTEVEEEK